MGQITNFSFINVIDPKSGDPTAPIIVETSEPTAYGDYSGAITNAFIWLSNFQQSINQSVTVLLLDASYSPDLSGYVWEILYIDPQYEGQGLVQVYAQFP